MSSTKKFSGKIGTDICKLFISNHNSIESYLAVSILYKKDKTGTNENQIGIYDIKNNIFKTEAEALDWADSWIKANFNTTPNFIAE